MQLYVKVGGPKSLGTAAYCTSCNSKVRKEWVSFYKLQQWSETPLVLRGYRRNWDTTPPILNLGTRW